MCFSLGKQQKGDGHYFLLINLDLVRIQDIGGTVFRETPLGRNEIKMDRRFPGFI